MGFMPKNSQAQNKRKTLGVEFNFTNKTLHPFTVMENTEKHQRTKCAFKHLKCKSKPTYTQ
jgi:hypothetical protein